MFEQMDIFSMGNDYYKIKKPIRLIELFGGIGSQAKALENLGVEFEHYGLVEFQATSVAAYNAIHGTSFPVMDITKTKAEDLDIVDTDRYEYIMCYSFPCQDLSLNGKGAGMRKNSGTRSGLLWEVERILDESKELPQILLMENVCQVHSTAKKDGRSTNDDFLDWQRKLEKLGYKNHWHDMNAADYGVPQRRKRTFMVSILNGNYTFPKKKVLTRTVWDLLETNADKKYYLSNADIERIRKWTAFEKPLEEVIVQSTKLCKTLTARGAGEEHSGMVLIKQNGIRKLTELESYRLMGFDDEDYMKAKKVCESKYLYQQAGNSIVVDVLMEIFGQML